MKAPVFIYLSKNKAFTTVDKYKVRASPIPVAATQGEIELKLTIDVPDGIFDSPDLEANIKVEKNTATTPSITIKPSAMTEWLKK